MVKNERRSTKITLVVGLFSILFLFTTTAHARIYGNIVAFGDSLTDHYGLQAYLGPYDPVANPNGAPDVWSDGDVWVEYLADIWGAELDNNAIAGAMTQGHESEAVQMLSDNGTLPNLGLVGQADMYVASVPEFDPEETLFTIWIGGNNLLEFGRGELDTTEPFVMITEAMTGIKDAVVTLYSQGATNFLILNLPDIGKTPAYNKRSPEVIASVTQLVQSYNASLDAAVKNLEASLEGITIYSFDVFTYFTEMIDSGVFVNVTDTYMEIDAEGNKTGNVNGDAEDYVFWDNIHPMTKAHKMVATEVDETIFSVKEADNDSSSTCFIDSVNGQRNGNADHFIFFVIASLLAGVGALISNKRSEK
ncbi:putative esterase, SGNH hydrolase-type, lipase, GDSL [Desulfamplus magnetovallimortis]|uniref:Putative esterase, SGNH hydrolase-type, lipase, GDSL n=1 Tax=Desulfamplus magnetovallimortis TaxID=1246637 RepID=A0A1W1H4I1_9BACT|nr:SGNH/GDSL hydrolase family protein [Desulfamplus magnetovallimortis]SLM27352.1 putative esterase, SGNH hydrolase-type, lipase, GDSL [Desulfamplus magnetovallimortis]